MAEGCRQKPRSEPRENEGGPGTGRDSGQEARLAENERRGALCKPLSCLDSLVDLRQVGRRRIHRDREEGRRIRVREGGRRIVACRPTRRSRTRARNELVSPLNASFCLAGQHLGPVVERLGVLALPTCERGETATMPFCARPLLVESKFSCKMRISNRAEVTLNGHLPSHARTPDARCGRSKVA